MQLTDHITIASLFSGAIVLFKAIEKAFEWASRKLGKADQQPVFLLRLDPEASRQLSETHALAREGLDIIRKTDQDGRLLVYEDNAAHRQLAAALADVREKLDRKG